VESLLAGSPDPEKTYMEEIRLTKLKLQLKYVRDMRKGEIGNRR